MSETALPPTDLLDKLPAAVFRLDRAYRYVHVNRQFCDENGVPATAVIGRTIFEMGYPPELAASFRAHTDQVFDTGRPVVHEFAIDLPAGRQWVRATLAPDAGPDGRVAGVIGIASLVTAQRQAEAARAEAEQRFRAFMDHSPALAWMKDADGRYVYQNAAYLRHFVPGGGDWSGRTDADVFPPAVAELLRRNDLAVLATGRPTAVQEEAPDPDGTVRTWYSVKFPFADAADRRYVGGIGFDVTDRLRLEADRARLEADARAAEERSKHEGRMLQAQKLESLGVLAGGIAHDFNNLLTAMLGYASLARMDLAADAAAAVPEYLEQIERGALRAADLCKQLLAYAGHGQFTVRPVSLNQLVEEMAALLATSISKKAVLRYSLADGLPAVKCDPTQVRQVVMNLITNASDAIGDTSGVITVATGCVDADAAYLRDIGADHLTPQRYAYLEVSDTGSGMDDRTRARIFEPFFTTKFTGRGLGLSAVMGIVRGHGGAVKVYSQVGRGTTFKVLLPTADGAALVEGGAVDEPAAFGRGRRLLVIDDEEDVRVFARKVLARVGFLVAVADDGKAGVEAYRADPAGFAGVLCDLTMPHLDGHAVFRELRQLRKDVVTVLMSGFAAEDATAGFEGKGLAGFLRKPFRAQDLLAAVYAAVGA